MEPFEGNLSPKPTRTTGSGVLREFIGTLLSDKNVQELLQQFKRNDGPNSVDFLKRLMGFIVKELPKFLQEHQGSTRAPESLSPTTAPGPRPLRPANARPADAPAAPPVPRRTPEQSERTVDALLTDLTPYTTLFAELKVTPEELDAHLINASGNQLLDDQQLEYALTLKDAVLKYMTNTGSMKEIIEALNTIPAASRPAIIDALKKSFQKAAEQLQSPQPSSEAPAGSHPISPLEQDKVAINVTIEPTDPTGDFIAFITQSTDTGDLVTLLTQDGKSTNAKNHIDDHLSLTVHQKEQAKRLIDLITKHYKDNRSDNSLAIIQTHIDGIQEGDRAVILAAVKQSLKNTLFKERLSRHSLPA